MIKARTTERGYSLPEMLVVMAIIGVLSLIVVPNFMSFYRATKLKSSMRQFTTDLRSARQRAVADNSVTKLTFQTDVQGGSYTIFESTDGKAYDDATKSWTTVATRTLEKPIFLTNTTLTDIGSDTIPGIAFINDGSCKLPAGVNPGTVVIKTNDNIGIPQYTISIYPYGKVSAT